VSLETVNVCGTGVGNSEGCIVGRIIEKEGIRKDKRERII
jgi:hypothetical protein